MDPFLIYAHRGASTVAPENTMTAFREAYRQGVKAIECDVQLSLDGVPVIIHDESLERTTNGRGLVQQYTLSELKALDAGSWFHHYYQNEPIPTLSEVFVWLQNIPMHLNIEIKASMSVSSQIAERVVELIQQYDLKERTVVSSYNQKILERIRQLDPKIPTALLYFYLTEPWKEAKMVGAQYIHALYPFLTAEVVNRSKREGIQVVPYTVDDWTDIRKMLLYGVSGIITNYPARVIRYLNHLKSFK